MGKHSGGTALQVWSRGRRGELARLQSRKRGSLPVFASLASFALVFVMLASPTAPLSSNAVSAVDPRDVSVQALMVPSAVDNPQTLVVAGEHAIGAARDVFNTSKIAPPPPPPSAVPASRGAPAAGVPDPGTAQAIAYEMVLARGWGQGEFDCLVALWNRESHWNVYAHNPSSGAYGIPQALPGDKMASAGADWATNPATQITWGLGYIAARYSTPCGAWASSQQRGWY